MSQSRPPRQKQPASAAPRSLPGIVSAAVVLLVLGIVVGLLVSTTAPAEQPAAQPSDDLAPTVAVADALPTLPPAATAAPAATAMPVVNTEMMPTATTYSYSEPPPMTIDPAKKYTATITTPRGDIVIELLSDIAPQTVNSFVFLARNNFYNGLTWHRVLPGFMAQGGDPAGDGTGGPGYNVPAEFTDTLSFGQPGIVGMARSSDPDSAGSQFFITTADASFLDGDYTIFGRVIAGQDVVDGIPLRDPQSPADTAAPGETILGITISEG